ncbi:MAG: hypothetical protein Q4B42_02670 [Oscillospiraceae bacterium]|nr:hypothetical protein [Oscillospiraceae bacterium]
MGLIHIDFKRLEQAAGELTACSEELEEALETLGRFEKAENLKKDFERALVEIKTQRLFLLESSKRFRGAQTRAVKRARELQNKTSGGGSV